MATSGQTISEQTTSEQPLARRLEVYKAKAMRFRKKFPAPRMEEYLEAAPELLPANPEGVTHIRHLLQHLSREACYAMADRLEPHLVQDLEALVAARDFEKRDERVFRLRNGPSALARMVLIMGLLATSKAIGIGWMVEELLELSHDAKILKMSTPFEATPNAIIGPPADPDQHCFLCLESIVPDEGDVDSVVHDTEAFMEYDSRSHGEEEDGEQRDTEEDEDLATAVEGIAIETSCGHIFCLECFSLWMDSSDRCPECRQLV